MADATEVRSDTAPTPTNIPAPAAAAEAAPAVAMAAAPEPAKPAEVPPAVAPMVEAAVKAEAPSIAAAPDIKVAPAAERPAAPATPASPSWMASFRSGIAAFVPSTRSAALAGGLGFAAGVGLLVATVGVMGVGHLFAAQKTDAGPAPWQSVANDTRALKQSVAKLEGQIAGLKASIDSASRQSTSQRAQITNRHEQSARSQAELQTRLAKISDAVERLEKRVTAAVAAEATGSVAPRYAAVAAGATPETPPPAAEAKVQAPPAPAKPPILEGWVIREVFRGRALVASRRGVFEAAPGLHLPEVGRVEAITRENGRWVVITEKGIITPPRPRAVQRLMPN